MEGFFLAPAVIQFSGRYIFWWYQLMCIRTVGPFASAKKAYLFFWFCSSNCVSKLFVLEFFLKCFSSGKYLLHSFHRYFKMQIFPKHLVKLN